VSFDSIPRLRASELLERYPFVLLDAYGVLITHDGPLPGAAALVDHLNGTGKPYLVLTNDASRSAATSAGRYRRMGLAVDPGRIVTSGMLLAGHFRERGLAGTTCAVLGPEDALSYVSEAGGVPVPILDDMDAEAVIVCDEAGYSMLEAVDRILSLLYRRIDAGKPVHLVLANPDLVYPAGPGRFGITGGAMALILEEALRFRYPERPDLRFTRLGKPHRPMFAEALRRSGTRDMVMVGDQLATDIRGAADFGIDSALVPTGMTRVEGPAPAAGPLPTWILESLELD
jgi:HAD superfamily hydrolase (TIGR01450 family)